MHSQFGRPHLKVKEIKSNKALSVLFVFYQMPLSLSDHDFHFRAGKLEGELTSKINIYHQKEKKEHGDLLNINIWGVGRCKQIKPQFYLHNLLKTTTSSEWRAEPSVSVSRLHLYSRLFALPMLTPTILRFRKTKRRYSPLPPSLHSSSSSSF